MAQGEESSGKHSNGHKCGKPYSAMQLCDNWAHIVEGNCMNFVTPLNPQKYGLEEIVSVLATSNYRSRFTRNPHHCCHAVIRKKTGHACVSVLVY